MPAASYQRSAAQSCVWRWWHLPHALCCTLIFGNLLNCVKSYLRGKKPPWSILVFAPSWRVMVLTKKKNSSILSWRVLNITLWICMGKINKARIASQLKAAAVSEACLGVVQSSMGSRYLGRNISTGQASSDTSQKSCIRVSKGSVSGLLTACDKCIKTE